MLNGQLAVVTLVGFRPCLGANCVAKFHKVSQSFQKQLKSFKKFQKVSKFVKCIYVNLRSPCFKLKNGHLNRERSGLHDWTCR